MASDEPADQAHVDVAAEDAPTTAPAGAGGRRRVSESSTTLDVGALDRSLWRVCAWTTAYLVATDVCRVVIAYAVLRDEYISYRDGPDPKGAFLFKLLDVEWGFRVLWGFATAWGLNMMMAPQVTSTVRMIYIVGLLVLDVLEILKTIGTNVGIAALNVGAWCILWAALLICFKGSRKKNILAVFLVIATLALFFAGIELYVPFCNAVPLRARGFVCSFMISCVKFFVTKSYNAFVKYTWAPGTNCIVLSVVASMLVSMTTTLKLLACIQAVQQAQAQAWSATMVEVLSICGSNTLFEIIDRNDLVFGFAYYTGCLRWRPRSIFEDMCYQCSFTMTYCYVVPLVPCILVMTLRQPEFFDINGSVDHLVRSGVFWAALAMFILFNGLSDLITLQLQRKSGERFATAFSRLRHCGEHRSFWKRQTSASEEPEVTVPTSDVDEEPVDFVFFGRRFTPHVMLPLLAIMLSVDVVYHGWPEMIGTSGALIREPVHASHAFS